MAWEEDAQVVSTNVEGLRYDSSSSTLEVRYKNGGIYQYFDVPQHIWDGLKAAPSKGAYLHQHIKGNFRYSKI